MSTRKPGAVDPPALASSEHNSPQHEQHQPGQSAPRTATGAQIGSVPAQEQPGVQELQERQSSTPAAAAAAAAAASDSSSCSEMAATKAELLLSTLQISDPLAGFPPPPSPLDGYPKLEELQMLLQNAAAGGSLLAASAAEGAGLLSGEHGEFGGEERAVLKGCGCEWWRSVLILQDVRSVFSREQNP